MSKPKILFLTLKRQWFALIESGEKTDEYRETKPYWQKRLITENGEHYRHFDYIHFSNGYSKDCPKMMVEYLRTSLHYGKKEWGAPEKDCVFIISLGKKLSQAEYDEILKKQI